MLLAAQLGEYNKIWERDGERSIYLYNWDLVHCLLCAGVRFHYYYTLYYISSFIEGITEQIDQKNIDQLINTLRFTSEGLNVILGYRLDTNGCLWI